jgi:hypothetical protein
MCNHPRAKKTDDVYYHVDKTSLLNINHMDMEGEKSKDESTDALATYRA